jgi:hypothetical protein
MKVRSSELTAVFLPTDGPNLGEAPLYNEAYRLWKDVWKQTYLELDDNPNVYSDDFTRQSELVSLFHGQRCLGMILMRYSDFRLSSSVEDSYFKVWPQHAVEMLQKDGPRIVVASHVTVDPQFRGQLEDGTRVSKLCMGLLVKRFVSSNADAMTGTMRVDRKMDKMVYETGATHLQSHIKLHGVDVELVAFYRKQLLKFQFDVNVERLWRNRIDIPYADAQQWHYPEETPKTQRRVA